MQNRRGKPKNIRERISYRLDNMLSRAPVYQLIGLGIFSFGIIVLGSLGYIAAGGIFREYPTYAIWHAILKIFDPGTMGVDTVPGAPGIAYSVPIRTVSVFLSMAGIFFLGLFISILTTGTENKLREIRKGKTRVFELDHTVILGWSTKVFTIIQEIIYSNDFGSSEIIVILSELEKEAMEDQIRERFPKLPKWLKIVCRTGISIVPEDLDNLNISRAKAVILIADESNLENVQYVDARAVKTLLALSHNPYIYKMKKAMPIIAEIEKREVVDVATLAAKGRARLVIRPEIISKIMVQTARQSGLSWIYSELLSFDGNELYVYESSSLIGKSFGDSLFFFNGQIPIGIIAKNPDKFSGNKAALNGILVNPPKNTRIDPGDSLIVISETEKIEVDSSLKRPPALGSVKPVSQDSRKPEHLLILGWSREIFHIIVEFDKYVIPGSKITVVSQKNPKDAQKIIDYEIPKLKNCTLKYEKGNRTRREMLENLHLDEYHSIMLLSELEEGDSHEVSDARTIMSLLLIRDILSKTNNLDKIRLVSEILDPKNQKITQVTRVNDIIISNELISQILTQASRQPDILDVYDALFAEEGSEIYLKPIQLYNSDLAQTSFRQLMACALERDEIAIGYKKIIENEEKEEESKIILNPENMDEVFSIGPKDRLVVLAEDETE